MYDAAGELDRQWAEFANGVLPSEPAPGQRQEMRLAFVAGWFAALSELVRHEDARRLQLRATILCNYAMNACQAELKALEARAAAAPNRERPGEG